MKDQPAEMTSAILATICFAIKDCQPHDFSDQFWKELNSVLRKFLRDRKRTITLGTTEEANQAVDDETLSMIKLAIEDNNRLDGALLGLISS